MIIINSILFIAALFICFFIPGKILLKILKPQLTGLEEIFFTTILGLVAFTLTSYVLESIKFFPIMYLLLIGLTFYFFKKRKSIELSFPKLDKKPFFTVLILAILFGIPMYLSGEKNGEFLLYGANHADAAFHISLIHELQFRFPPNHPGFAGGILQNYHFFADYVVAKITQIFHIDTFATYFILYPFFTALSWGVGVYLLMKKWSGNKNVALWAVFLTYFGGSFAFILRLRGINGLSLDSAFGMLQPAVSLVNPPFAISIVILICGLFSLFEYTKTKKKGWLIPIILFFGLSAEFKVYAGIIMLGGIIIFSGLQLFRRNLYVFPMLLGISILFFITYWRFTGGSGFLIPDILWAPISIFRDNFPLFNYDNQLYKYTQYFDVGRLIWLYVVMLGTFIFGNLGTRTLGWILIIFRKEKKKIVFSIFGLTVFAMLLISFLIPLFFIQSIKVFEISQLFNYFLFFSSLFAAFGLGAFFSLKIPRTIKAILIIIIVISTLPSAYEIFQEYTLSPNIIFNKNQYSALKFLSHQGSYDQTLLTFPPFETHSKNDVIPWSNIKTNIETNAVAAKQGYFADENITSPTDLDSRREFIQTLVEYQFKPSEDADKIGMGMQIEGELKTRQIKFIYSTYPLTSFEKLKSIKKIYSSSDAYVYKIL